MTYALPKTITNYGIFNIGFQCAKIWKAISVNIKPWLPFVPVFRIFLLNEKRP